MPYGRGGTGNLLAAEEEKKRRQEDLEAANRIPPNPTSIPPQSNPPKPSNLSQDYAHYGRGGSGNWYEPKILAQTGIFSSPNSATSPTSPLDQSRRSSIAQPDKETVSDTRSRGRGGAGNFVWSQEDEERAREEERGKEIELKEMVARDVERALPRPDKVVKKTEKVDRAFVRDWED